MAAGSTIEENYLKVATVLEILLGTSVFCVSSLVLAGYSKVYSWRKPFSILIMNLLLVDIVNGVIGLLHAVNIKVPDIPNMFRTIFFLQALFLWVSLITLVLLNLSRLVGIIAPFRYSSLFSIQKTWILVLITWITGFVLCFINRFADFAGNYTYYSVKVLFHISLNVIILILAITTLWCLEKNKENHCETRRRATKTVVIVSVAYFFSYGYYCYVYIVWMIPGLPTSNNPWLKFTAVDKSSLSLAHLFLVAGSLFNGILLGIQPNIVAAIRHIHVWNYQKEVDRRSRLQVVCSAEKVKQCPLEHMPKNN